MFLISIIGAGVAPLLVVVASYIHIKTKQPTPTIWFHQLFTEVNLYTTLVIGFPLYGVVIAYMFTREYTEDTLKNLLTIPVSRISFIISKFIILFLWIVMLTLVAWTLTLILGVLGGFPGVNTRFNFRFFSKIFNLCCTSLSIVFTYSTINSCNEELCTAYYINSHYYND